MLIELAKDGLGDETLLIAKDGVVTDGSNTERAKSIELGRERVVRVEIFEGTYKGSVWRASWSSVDRASKNWVTRFKPQRETLLGRSGVRSV
jgi:hypothetical protein